MADLEQKNVKQLLDFVKANPDRAQDVAQRFNLVVEQFIRRNDDLSTAVGRLEARDKQDEYRIDDLIELRDKINDGFGVLEENEVAHFFCFGESGLG